MSREQIRQLNPPPNRVKDADSRTAEYRELYGDKCWELDTLPPHELNRIVETEIIDCIDDMGDFKGRHEEDLEGRERLRVVGKHFDAAHEWAKTCEDDEGEDGGDEDFEDDESDDDEDFEDDEDCEFGIDDDE